MRQVVGLALLLAGCSPQSAGREPEGAVAEARRDAARKLKDPGSARFDAVREVRAGVVCGRIRGRGSAGGYDAPAAFVWLRSDAVPAGDPKIMSGAHVEGDELDGYVDQGGWQPADFAALRGFARC